MRAFMETFTKCGSWFCKKIVYRWNSLNIRLCPNDFDREICLSSFTGRFTSTINLLDEDGHALLGKTMRSNNNHFFWFGAIYYESGVVLHQPIGKGKTCRGNLLGRRRPTDDLETLHRAHFLLYWDRHQFCRYKDKYMLLLTHDSKAH